MPKKIAVEIGCGSFDQPDLQSLHDYIFFFFSLPCNIENVGACNISVERYSQNLSKESLHAPKFLKY